MGERFVELDSKAFEDFLKSHGFEKIETKTEVVYIRRHHQCRHLMVKVYTSVGARQNTARSCGEDAIKICQVFDNGRYSCGVGKTIRVYRTAPPNMTPEERQKHVFERTLQRMREAYAGCNDWLKRKRAERNANYRLRLQ